MNFDEYDVSVVRTRAQVVELPPSTVLAMLRFIAARDHVRFSTLMRRFKVRHDQAWHVLWSAYPLRLGSFCSQHREFRVERGAFRRVLELGVLVEREGLLAERPACLAVAP